MSYAIGPFDSQHVYVQWGGKLPGNEQWSCGIRMYSTVTGGSLTRDPGFLAAVETAIQAFHTSPNTNISAAAKLSFVKANNVGTDGHYLEAVTEQVIVADVGGNGPAAPTHPNQIALCYSLVTGYSRGPAHRGRFYAPLPCHVIGADGLMDASGQLYAKNAGNALVTALNAITANLQVGVFSRKLGSPGHRKVTGVEVGRVLDTQRRRRRSLLEQY
jgi:hypothetical protein